METATIEFLKRLGVMIVGVAFVGGFGYWTLTLLKKANFHYWFKYNILRKKYNEKEIARLMDYNQAGMDVVEVNKFLLTSGGFDPKRVKELCWIYSQIKLKGGTKNNE